jgi:flagellar hook-length control protein FliK
MTAMSALAAAPLRAPAAPTEDAARNGDGDSGSFAAALDQAREPAGSRAKTSSRADAKGPVTQKTAADPARADEAIADAPHDRDSGGDANADGSDHTAPDLALLLPGWTAPAVAHVESPVAATDAAAAAAPAAAAAAAAAATATVAVSAADEASSAVGAPGECGAVATANAAADSRTRTALAAPAALAASPSIDARSATALAAPAAPTAPAIPAVPTAPTARGEHTDSESSLPAPGLTPPSLSPIGVDRPHGAPRHSTPAAAVEAAPSAAATQGRDAPATAAVTSSALPTTAAQVAVYTAPVINTPVGSPFEARVAAALDSAAFAPALASQVTWLVHEGQHHARLTLNPAEMGPVTVKIEVDGTHARVDFSAEMAATRSAIEASLPTLAAALNDSGLTLAGGGVFDGAPRHGTPGERATRMPGPPAPHAPQGTSTTAGDTAPALPLRAARGLVDLIA